jgi:DNA polymerase III psi subunit
MNQRSLYFLQQMNIDVWQSRRLLSQALEPKLLVVSDEPIVLYRELMQGICLALSIEWQEMKIVRSYDCPVKHSGWLLWCCSQPCSLAGARLLLCEPLKHIAQDAQLKRQLWQAICHYDA